ncbi:hypothetical protein KIL84_013946 [Mauremys mutica]|uniref:Uncharacterized protein n=1 Tax=Mauremys mutica TaxID=74926 RepID=A0A9D3WWY7_9SAUR|nr:hypothetical protein KIL84_013946 [Mauremys mutica]
MRTHFSSQKLKSEKKEDQYDQLTQVPICAEGQQKHRLEPFSDISQINNYRGKSLFSTFHSFLLNFKLKNLKPASPAPPILKSAKMVDLSSASPSLRVVVSPAGSTSEKNRSMKETKSNKNKLYISLKIGRKEIYSLFYKTTCFSFYEDSSCGYFRKASKAITETVTISADAEILGSSAFYSF